MHQAQILALNFLFLSFQLFLQLRQLAVLQLCGLIQVILLLGSGDVAVYLLNLLTQSRQMRNGILLILPLCLLAGKLVMEFSQVLLQVSQTLLA